MAINPAAVREFRARKLKNSDLAKNRSELDLDDMLQALSPVPQFKYEPYWHQKVCFFLGLKYPKYIFFLDMGLGKTKLSLDLFAYRKLSGEAKRCLVLVEGSVHTTSWAEEAKVHAPSLRVVPFDDKMSAQERRDAVMSECDVCVVTYQGWCSLVCGGQKKGKMKIDPAVAREFERQFDFVILDESSCVANHQSLWFKAAKRLRAAKYLYELTGTGFSGDPHRLWPQFFLVDDGQTLGETLGLFRSAYFKLKHRAPWQKWDEWEFDKKYELDLHRALKNRSIRFTEDECLGLPPMIGGIENPVIRAVALPLDTWKYYNDLVDEFNKADGNIQVMQHAYTRMRMIASGYLPLKDAEGGEHTIVFASNPKLDMLESLVAELPEGEKVIVAHHFIKSGELIAARLKKYSPLQLNGDTKDPGATFIKFRDSKKHRVLIASKTASKGLNLQFCRRLVFFESPDDIETRTQYERRIRRPKQDKTTYCYDLVIKGSVEEVILKKLDKKKQVFDAIMDGKTKLSRMI